MLNGSFIVWITTAVSLDHHNEILVSTCVCKISLNPTFALQCKIKSFMWPSLNQSFNSRVCRSECHHFFLILDSNEMNIELIYNGKTNSFDSDVVMQCMYVQCILSTISVNEHWTSLYNMLTRLAFRVWCWKMRLITLTFEFRIW